MIYSFYSSSKLNRLQGKMNKNTKILLGVGALAVVGYFVYKNNKPKANASGNPKVISGGMSMPSNAWQDSCTKCYTSKLVLDNGDVVYTCQNGNHATKLKNDTVKAC